MRARHVLRFSFLLMGFGFAVTQTLLIREFMLVFFGNELCIGIVLACWLLGISCGAVLGGAVLKRWEARLSQVFFLVLGQSLFLVTGLVLLRLLRGIFSVPPGVYLPIDSLSLSTTFTVIPFSAIVGALFPLLCKLSYQGRDRESSREISLIYFVKYP